MLKKFCSVIEEGSEDLLFVEEASIPLTEDQEEDTNKIDVGVFQAGNRNEDIKYVRNQGLLVDDDNDPA